MTKFYLMMTSVLLVHHAIAEEPGKSFFRTLALDAAPTDLSYQVQEKEYPLPVADDARSDFLAAPADGQLVLLRSSAGADGGLVKTPAYKLNLRQGGPLPLVLFYRGKNGVECTVLDDSLLAFPAGSYRALNRIEHEVGLILGKSKATVPAGGDQTLALRGQGADERTVFARLFLIEGAKSKLVYSNNWGFSEMVRTLVVISSSEQPAGLPQVRRIVEPVDLVESKLNPPRP